MNVLSHLPGGDLILQGLRDSAAGHVTPAACLISIGWPRLSRAGLDLQGGGLHRITAPEHRLYQLLDAEGGDAYSRYNSFIRRLISFEQSLERESARHPLISAPAHGPLTTDH